MGFVSTFWPLWIMLLWIVSCKFLWIHVFIILGHILRSGNAGTYDNSMFNILGNCNYFTKQLYHFTFPSATCEGCSCSTFSLIVDGVDLFHFSHFSGHLIVSCYGFILHFIIDKWYWTHFDVIIGHLHIFFCWSAYIYLLSTF